MHCSLTIALSSRVGKYKVLADSISDLQVKCSLCSSVSVSVEGVQLHHPHEYISVLAASLKLLHLLLV